MSSDTDIIIALARKLEAENTQLRAQNEALRAGQGRWPESDDSPAGEQVPRRKTMSALPTTPGSLVLALEPRVERFREEVQRIAKAIATPQVSTDTPPPPRLTVHALNTAPVGSEVVYGAGAALKRLDGFWGIGIFRPSISAEDLMERIVEAGGVDDATLTHPEEITPEPEPTPQLTAHQLNTAPVGSVVSKANRHWTKTINGAWFRVTRFGQAEKRTSEELLAAGYTNATLASPEGGRP